MEDFNFSKDETEKMMEKIKGRMSKLSESLAQNLALRSNYQTTASDLDLHRKISDIMSGLRPPQVSFDDGDQSPLNGEKAQLLRNQWSTGMDYVPHEPVIHYLSSWLKIIYSGDYDSMMKMLENKSETEIKKMIDRRESLMNISAIFHVVVGARTLSGTHPDLAEVQKLSKKNLNVKSEHIQILEKLLSLGADVNVRDVAGYTPLHHCLQYHGNKTTLKMAGILIKAGAKVDAKNRFGATPLIDATLSHRYDFIKFLSKNRADWFIQDNEGATPFSLSQLSPKIKEIFFEARSKEAGRERERLREEFGGSFKKCSVCGEEENTKRCTGCYFVWYCGSKCQREDWSSHKTKCKKVQSEFLGCVVKDNIFSGISSSGKVFTSIGNNKTPKKKHFVVKVQIPLKGFEGITVNETGTISIYNKDRSYTAYLEKEENEIVHKALMKEVQTNGVNGLKGYFYAFLDSSNKLSINPSRILPPETW